MRAFVLLLLILSSACASYGSRNTQFKAKSDQELKIIGLKAIGKDTMQVDEVKLITNPSNESETIFLFTEVVNEEYDGEVYDLNSHILIIHKSGVLTHQFFESGKETGWYSDAVFIDAISIDTTVFYLGKKKDAFGIKVTHRNSSQPNPYHSESLSLYVKQDKSLKKVLSNFIINETIGEVNVNVGACSAYYESIETALEESSKKNKSLHDIIITERKTISEIASDNNGECLATDKIVAENQVILKYDNHSYKVISKRLELGND